MEYRQTITDQRVSDNDQSKRDIPSFIEPLPPLISNPFMRPKPVKGTNLLELFEEDSEYEEPELVQVYLRLKPCDVPSNLYEVQSDQCLITSVDTATAGHGRRTQHNVSKAYTFTKIFGPEANQKEIFETVVKDNLRQLADGHSYTLLTYGASGSGKTYTLMGTVQSPGLVPRSLEYVFRVVDAAQQPLCKPSENGAEKLSYAQQEYELQWVKKLRHVSAPLRDKYRRMSAQLRTDFSASTIDLSNRTRYYVWVSFIEIYNESIYDLLVTGDRRSASKLRIREDSSGQVYVKGATQAFVRSGEEAYDVLVAGKHNLQVAATGVHAHSSRSHCIFTITLLTETDNGDMRVSCVRLCDLAGSERQANTRNAGARMAESRAINSSLHVLERCLHMLRRRQKPGTNPGLVPYRESKLTRLLGTGLSGSRGEAVSMVVAINPHPARAHETRHVLQLAAVARDIHVNNTIAESTIDTEANTTVHVSTELMRLRADNERLHFELVQAQSRNKELLCAMEEKQQEAASTMRELVDEAKDLTKQYYEAQMASLEHRLRNEMEDLIEDYEAKLRASGTSSNGVGTPSRTMQNMVARLTTEITILEEKLSAEQLARARAEQEVQHLRACIEERDHEKCPDDNPSESNRDVLLLSDSEQSDDDELNESLEPSFRKEDLNATAQRRKSSVHPASSESDQDTTLDNTAKSASVFERSVDTKSTESGLERSSVDANKTDVLERTFDQAAAAGVLERSTVDTKEQTLENLVVSNDLKRSSIDTSAKFPERTSKNSVDEYNSCTEQTDDIKDRRSTFSRNVIGDDSMDKESFKQVIDTKRGTYYIGQKVEDSVDSGCSISKTNGDSKDSVIAEDNQSKNSSLLEGNVNVSFEGKTVGTVPKTVIDKLKSQVSVDKLSVGNESLAMFEQFEKEFKRTVKGQKQPSEEFIRVDLLKEKRNYFEEDKDETPMETSEKEVDTNLAGKKAFDASKVEETVGASEKSSGDILKFSKPKKTYFSHEEIESASEETVPKKSNEVLEHTEHYFADKEIKSELVDETRKSMHYAPAEKRKVKIETTQRILETSDEFINITKLLKEKRTYFDNIDNKISDAISSNIRPNDLRSPSIVKDEVSKDYEPTTIKKLLGDSITAKLTSSAAKSKTMSRIHDSLDIFEEVTSPKLAEIEENLCVESLQKCLKKFSIVDGPAKESVKQIEVIYNTETIEAQKTRVATEEITKKDDSNAKPSGATAKLTRAENITINAAIDKETEKIESGNNNTNDTTVENSITAFENIYKDITAPRVTEFELLVTQDVTETQFKEVELASSDKSTARYNETHFKEVELASSDTGAAMYNQTRYKEVEIASSTAKYNETQLKEEVELASSDKSAANYNKTHLKDVDDNSTAKSNLKQNHALEKSDNKKPKQSKQEVLSKTNSNEDLTKSVRYNLRHVKRENEDLTTMSTVKTKRSLRLKRRKNFEDESLEDEKSDKLKDIANLQKDFADVIADAPEVVKVVKDIPSPEGKEEGENVAPLAAQSCPSKSVTRSRRKLFTPRAEPLEESLNTGDSNERICVPRPSYHRGRARRKL